LSIKEICPAMTDTSAFDNATRRLSKALEALEAAVERRSEADRDEEAMAAQIQALGGDRARLAADLDAAAAHARAMEMTNREIARRLDLAIESIRSVVDANER
jgi:hypothetical protein